jgi:hypothetical protein
MVQAATVTRDPDPAIDHAEPAARPGVQSGGAVQPQLAGRLGQHLPARRLMLLAHVDLLGEYPQLSAFGPPWSNAKPKVD